jgi:hypothetical protein
MYADSRMLQLIENMKASETLALESRTHVKPVYKVQARQDSLSEVKFQKLSLSVTKS